jgi:hypothetical protein
MIREANRTWAAQFGRAKKEANRTETTCPAYPDW